MPPSHEKPTPTPPPPIHAPSPSHTHPRNKLTWCYDGGLDAQVLEGPHFWVIALVNELFHIWEVAIYGTKAGEGRHVLLGGDLRVAQN